MIQREVTIGRAPGSDILFGAECPYISNNHALIYSDGYRLILKDTSTNGTYVNDNCVHHQSIVINYGDSILLAGKYPLEWEQIAIFFPVNPRSPMTIVNPDRKTTKYEPNKIGVLPDDYDKKKNIAKNENRLLNRLLHCAKWIGVVLSIIYGLLFIESGTDSDGITGEEEYIMYTFYVSVVITIFLFYYHKKRR